MMKTFKLMIHRIVMAMLMMVVQPVMAGDGLESGTYREAEISRSSIKVASDGTGVIDDFSCRDCGFKLLKVTTETKGYLNNAEIGTVQLIKQANTNVGVARYALNSNTVYEIRFSH